MIRVENITTDSGRRITLSLSADARLAKFQTSPTPSVFLWLLGIVFDHWIQYALLRNSYALLNYRNIREKEDYKSTSPISPLLLLCAWASGFRLYTIMVARCECEDPSRHHLLPERYRIFGKQVSGVSSAYRAARL